MTPEEFRAALDTLGYTPPSVAKLLGVDVRTARRWGTGAKPIPDSVAAQLTEIIAAGGVTPKMVAEIRAIREDSAQDPSRFLWVQRRGGDAHWTVAEHDVISNVYYLPGAIERFTMDELVLGAVIDAPKTVAGAEATREDVAGNASRFLWVQRRGGDAHWTVAEHDVTSNGCHLPGRIERFTMDELVPGSMIAAPKA